jgi:hypothetical protein
VALILEMKVKFDGEDKYKFMWYEGKLDGCEVVDDNT